MECVEGHERGTDCFSEDGLVARAQWPGVRTRCEPLSGVSIPIPRGSRGQILPLAPQPTSDRFRHGDQSADARHRALNDLIVRRDYEAGLITRWCGLRLVAGADRGLHGPSFDTSAVGHTSG